MKTTEERLAKLECELARANRRFYVLLTGVSVFLGLVAALWVLGLSAKALASGRASKEVRADSFILEDKNGKARASLSIYEDGPMLRLESEDGKMGAALYLSDDRAGLTLNDQNGKHRAVLAVTQNTPILCLYDEGEEPRASLAVSKGRAYLTLLDENGKPVPIR